MGHNIETTAWVTPEFKAFAERRAKEIFKGMTGNVPDSIRQTVERQIIDEARMHRIINVRIKFEHELYPAD